MIHNTTLENEMAFKIYNYLKKQIKTLPQFWYQVIEENSNNNDALLFMQTRKQERQPYFSNENFKYINYRIYLIRNKNQHIEQLKQLEQLVIYLQKIRAVENANFITKKINGVVTDEGVDKSFQIEIDEPTIDNEGQSYYLDFDILIERKETEKE
ncbi:hypothetical protein [Mesomycoplasma molare]|uniref:Uncharacterized protein n=1 Tax=Mesomycoplasma molare TaxID=171288 RepID=A0ABY5TX04_9BACT|nr:hypothetical protein [Mesomycoplasma molare]UWD34056.1 hypothetical protein NX772_03040 [Mesomycoplasma molare]